MKTNDTDKEILKENLKKAVVSCPKLKFGNCTLKSSFFTIKNLHFLDFTEEKFIDGTHSFTASSSVDIIKKDDGDVITKSCELHFNAEIKGNTICIQNGIIITDINVPNNFINDEE